MKPGRESYAGRWMSRWPIATLGAIAAGPLVAFFWSVVLIHAWTPTQRFSFAAYVRSSVSADLDLPAESYTVLGVSRRVDNARLSEWLRTTLYGGEAIGDLFRMPVVAGLATMGVLLIAAIPADIRRQRDRRVGRRLKGPELVKGSRISDATDGVPLHQRRGGPVVIPRALETSHLLLVGDTGTGKSTVISDILATVASRGETAIVYDPAVRDAMGGWIGYARHFYRPERGDVILNPVDLRCPYWKPGDEVRNDAEALTLATALFPPRPGEANTFFTDSARGIFAYLLTKHPTSDDLVEWMTIPAALDALVKGTVHEAMLTPKAQAQRAGVLASLNLVGDRLQLCIREDEPHDGRWSAAEWAEHRKGWIFLTSTPETRERLRSLQTLWMDSLILRLMGAPSARRTWLVVDELAQLNKLPQLHTAVTEGRKANLALVLGFQGRAQLEARYGHDAETMLSQPATKIFLRASDAKAAKWASETIGDVEIERMKESRQAGLPASARQTSTLERQVEPLVMPSEIGGLANLAGYIKIENRVSLLSLRYVDRPAIAPGLMPRPARVAPVSAHHLRVSREAPPPEAADIFGAPPDDDDLLIDSLDEPAE